METNQEKIRNSQNVIFVSGSFDPRSKNGVGCKLVLTYEECAAFSALKTEKMMDKKRKLLQFITEDFEPMTTSRFELKTMLWAIDTHKIEQKSPTLMVCTDFRTNKGLLERRLKLEETNYASARKDTTLANADLYKEFFKLHDRLGFNVLCEEDKGEQTTEQDTLSLLLLEVNKHSRETLSNQLKANATDKIAGKWF